MILRTSCLWVSFQSWKKVQEGRPAEGTDQPKTCGFQRSIVYFSLTWVPPQSEVSLSLFCFAENVNTVPRTNCCLGNNILFDFAGHTFAYFQVNGTYSYCLNSWCVKDYFLVLLFFCINLTTFSMENKMCHGFWCV